MYDWTEINSETMTNLYLWGVENPGGDLVTDWYLRDPGTRTVIIMDAASYMVTGPGRFAHGCNIDVVSDFMNGGRVADTGRRQVYNVADLLKKDEKANLALVQYDFTDSVDDYVDRAYVYGSGSFKVSGDARFVVEADGTRHIEGYALWPFDDNFDFDSNDYYTKLVNSILEEKIDPWHIGRRVDIEFDNKGSIPTTDYGMNEYYKDIALTNKERDPLALIRMAEGRTELFERLAKVGVTDFVDTLGRTIIFGTTGDDNWTVESKLGTLPGSSPLLETAVDGVTVVAGDGNDTIMARDANDNLHGFDGNDHLTGGAGINYLTGGQGHDFLDGRGGSDLLIGDSDGDPSVYGNDTIHGGAGNDSMSGGDGDDLMYGGADNDIIDGGRGYDTYIYNTGDGYDQITDITGDGVILFDGEALGPGYRDSPSDPYTTADGKHTYVANGSRVIIDGSIELTSHGYNGAGKWYFGIALVDLWW